MAAPDRRAQIKASLQNKTKESYERRDDSGQFKSIFKDEYSSKSWKCGEGEHLIDIIPYPAGGHDPKSKNGEWGYLLDIWVHYAVGVNQDAYVCPARNYSLPCPICEYREEVRRTEDYDEDLVKELTPKRRSIYNVVSYDSEKETAKGVMIFDCAHWFMEKHISSLAKTPSRGAGKSTESYIAFSDPDEGKSIAFTRKGSRRNTEFLGHKFVDRNYIIDDGVLNTAFILDDCINIFGYEDIKNAFLGGAGGDVAPEVAQEAPPPSAPPVQERIQRVTAPAPSAEPAATPVHRVRTVPAATAMVCPVEGGVFGVDCEKFTECNGCELWNPCSEEADKLQAGGGEAPATVSPRPSVAPVSRPQPRPVPAPVAAPVTRAATGAPPTGPRRGLKPRG